MQGFLANHLVRLLDFLIFLGSLYLWLLLRHARSFLLIDILKHAFYELSSRLLVGLVFYDLNCRRISDFSLRRFGFPIKSLFLGRLRSLLRDWLRDDHFLFIYHMSAVRDLDF